MSRPGFVRGVLGASKRRRLDRRFRRLKAELLEDRLVLAEMTLIGAGAGGGPHVRAYQSPTLNQDFNSFVYAPNFTGGVRVASADVNGDGRVDLITVPGPGGGPHVRVFDGGTGAMISEFFAFEASFTGGLNVAAGDINLDGRADVFVGAEGPASGGRARVFDALNGALLKDVVAPGNTFAGGVRVAAGDVNGDGRADLVMGAAPGNVPRVVVRDLVNGQILRDFLAYGPGFGGGLYVAAGDVSGDGRADIVTGADAGGGPHVRVFDGAGGQEIRGLFAYDPGFRGGVRVATTDFNGDGIADIVTGAGPGGGPHVRVLSGSNLAQLREFFAFDLTFTGGVFVGGSLLARGTGFIPIPTPQPNPIDLAGNGLKVVNLAHWDEKLMALASIRNNGTADSGPFNVEWYLSRDPLGSSDDILLSRPGGDPAAFSHPSVPAGSVGTAFTVMLQLPGSLPPALTGQNFYIVMRTDSASQVAETDESNNFGQVGDGRDREPIVITTTPPANLGFRIEVRFLGGLTPTQIAVFQTAADRWSQAIAGDLPDVAVAGLFVDDLLIDASGINIDGPGGILGQAAPTVVRATYGNLPVRGIMQFDIADLALREADGSLLSDILHEMGHVLGFGALWRIKGLVANSGLLNPRFIGALATQEYNRIFGRNETSIPIEPIFEGHWDESVFTNELMTPFADGISDPLSSITVASLADLGYHVNLVNSDPFTPFSVLPLQAPPSPGSGALPGGMLPRMLAPPDSTAAAYFILPPLDEPAVWEEPLDENALLVPPPEINSPLPAPAAPAQAQATDSVLAGETDYSAGESNSLDLLAAALDTSLADGLEDDLFTALAE